MFPVNNATRSYWMTPPSMIDEHRSETFPEVCDIAIVGSGYAGATMAYYLLSENPHLNIVMLEARAACSGATGRNGGHLKPDIYVSYEKYKTLYGHDGAKEIFDFELAHLQAFQDLIEKEQIDCQFRLTRAMDTLMSSAQLDHALSNLKAASEAGIDVSMVQIHDRPEAATRIEGSVGALSFPAGCLSPYRFVTSLLEICLARGLNLQTYTCVTSTKRSSDTEEIVLETPRGDIKAKQVVYATNAYTSAILPELSEIVIPVKGTAANIPVSMKPTIDHTWGIKWSPLINNYMIRHESNLVIGGAKEVIMEQKDLWYNCADDSTLIPRAQAYFRDFTHKRVLDFTDQGTENESITWTGIMGYSKDFQPLIGARYIAGESQPNEYIHVAHNGHGMPRILLASLELSKLVSGTYKAEKEMKIPQCMRSLRLSSSDAKEFVNGQLKAPKIVSATPCCNGMGSSEVVEADYRTAVS